jgi:hypothetical protein
VIRNKTKQNKQNKQQERETNLRKSKLFAWLFSSCAALKHAEVEQTTEDETNRKEEENNDDDDDDDDVPIKCKRTFCH